MKHSVMVEPRKETELAAADQGYAKAHGHPTGPNIVQEIAMDIGKSIAAYIEVMYPEAVTAASSTFLLSVRNSVYNEIMASLELTEEGAIRAQLLKRKKFRREWKSAYKKIRAGKLSKAEPEGA